MAEFYSFYSISNGILKIFFLLAIGYVVYVRGLIGKNTMDGISNLLIWVCLPALIFTRIISTFKPSDFSGWWILPVSSVLISVLGLGLGYVFQRPIRDFRSRREFMVSCAFQNCGYIPMTLVFFVCHGPFCDKLLVYIFLFLIGFNAMIWSFVPAFFSRDTKKRFKVKTIFNPPVIAILFSLLWVFLIGNRGLHHVIYDPLTLLGDATFPLALIVLGAQLAEYKGFELKNLKALSSCLFVKLVLLPAIILLLLQYIAMTDVLKFFILLEATMPVAVTLVIIGQYTGADNKFLSGVIFYSHFLAIFTIPLWLLLFRII